jgi:type I restriction enzyme M protein
MANPPFNVKWVNKDAVQWNDLYSYWIPSTDNANYLWIQMFRTTLSSKWRAGFVMANSASDARNSESTIREQMIRENAVDVMISIWPNMFYNVTLPCTLRFFDKYKVHTPRKDTVLFVNAKDIFRQVDRAHREFTDEQLEYITRIVQLYRWEEIDSFDTYIASQKVAIQEEIAESQELLDESKDNEEKKFLTTEISTLEERLTIADDLLEHYTNQFNEWYEDIAGLCKVATLEEIENNSRSLNPWRYTWVASTEDPDFDFEATMTELHEEFQTLTSEAHEIEKKIVENMDVILSQ